MRQTKLAVLLAFAPLIAAAQVHYPGNDAFHIIDMSGDATVQEVEDANIPLAQDARALEVMGEHVIGLAAQAAAMDRGVLLALYREMDPVAADADGILLFDADYPMDISEAHNVKQNRRQVWLEVDNDSGLHFRGVDERGEERPLTAPGGLKLLGEAWPETGWLWQKVAFGDGILRGKCWEATQDEPEAWDIETRCDSQGGRVGFRIGSGHMRLAYFAVLDENAPLQRPPALFLYPPKSVVADTGLVPLRLYSNFAQAGDREVALSVHHESGRIGGIERTLPFPAGPARTEFKLTSRLEDRGERSLRLHSNPPRGQWVVQAAVDNETDEATVQVIDTAAVTTGMEKAEQAAQSVAALFSEADAMPGELDAALCAVQSHLHFGRELLNEGRVDEATRALNYALSGLNELRGPKGMVRPEIGPLLANLPAAERHPNQGKGEKGVQAIYDPAWRVRFGAPSLEAQTMVMGRGYAVRIPVSILGESPGRDLTFQAELRSPYGHRIPAQASVAPDPPTSAWQANTEHQVEFLLNITADDAVPLTPEPLVLDEYHDLIVRAVDPKSGAPVLFANPPGRQYDLPGTGFGAAQIFVSSAPVEIREFAPADSAIAEPRADAVAVAFLEGAPDALDLLFTAEAANGETLFQEMRALNPNEGAPARCVVNWTPSAAGKTTLRVALIHDDAVLSEARREVCIAPPCPIRIEKRKETVRRDDGTYATRLPVFVSEEAEARVEVYADKRLVGQGAPGVVECEPWFGYYDIVVFGQDWRYIERIAATTVTTQGADLVVNGEPFLVKGVNVHGMDPRSPERTRVMMRLLKERNFNMLRGDYPPPWQMDMALEMNMVYTVLAPFSCASTNEIFERQDGPPLVVAREMSRAMVDRYAECPGVLLWNSCNEIVGELDHFLLSLYPMYARLDPYRRPVHYANLYAQDAVRGQDLVGMNYYFGVGERATDRHAIILRGIRKAHDQGLPVFYNEFNSWYGAVPGTGAEALRDLFQWGNEQGMTGGIFYFRFNSDRHPGIFDGDYNTHKIIDEALHKAFDDARVALASTEGRRAVRIENPRRFTLRQVRLALKDAPEQRLADLAPGEAITVDLPPETGGVEVQGAVHYVTHHGFTGAAPFRLFARQGL